MASYLGYFLLGAGVLTLLIAWRDKSRKSLPRIVAATWTDENRMPVPSVEIGLGEFAFPRMPFPQNRQVIP